MKKIENRVLLFSISIIGFLVGGGNLLWAATIVYDKNLYLGCAGFLGITFLFGVFSAWLNSKTVVTPLLFFSAPILLVGMTGLTSVTKVHAIRTLLAFGVRIDNCGRYWTQWKPSFSK
ncbi:MAG: hypothetical protein ACTHMT_00970 [Verrucomicrobiota bacterium]